MVMGLVDVSCDLVGNTYNHIHSKPGTKTYNTLNIKKETKNRHKWTEGKENRIPREWRRPGKINISGKGMERKPLTLLPDPPA